MPENRLQNAAPQFGVGQSMRRVEDERFLRGTGLYVDDLTLDRQAYAAFFRSPYAHARLVSVDVSAAQNTSGVLGVYSGADLAEWGLSPFGDETGLRNADGSAMAPVEMPQLAQERVLYVGHPVAMIVAETRDALREGVERVRADFEELPVALDPRAENPQQLHDAAPGNTAYLWTHGDAAACEAVFQGAHMTLSVEAPSQRIVVASIEPRAINAQWDGATERWTVHCGTQGSHSMRARLSAQLGVAPERIRVLTPDVGGGFGMKLMVHPEYAPCLAAARALGRPVKWTSDRSEAFLSDAQGRAVDVTAEGAFDADGRLLAARLRQISDLGAHHCQYSAGIHSIFSAALVGGLYDLEAVFVETRGVFTNKPPMDAYRGAGRPEAVYATELLMEAGARRLDIDPAEMRRRNLRPADAAPFTTATGMAVDSADGRALLQKALDAARYDEREARKTEAKARGMLRGVGVSCYVERTGGPPMEQARIRLRDDGRLEAWSGLQSTGQGHETAFIQVIHQELGVAPDQIEFRGGDSDALPVGGGTGGSRSLIVGHQVFQIAAADLVEKSRAVAAGALQAQPEEVTFTPAGGGLFQAAGASMTLAETAAHLASQSGAAELTVEGAVTRTNSTWPNGTHIAEIEIDPETGASQMVDYVIVDDFGTILNPLLAAGQVHGGTAQGIGQVLFEQAVFDPDSGQPITGSFLDYAMIRAADMPPLRISFHEEAPCRTNPLGVKGAGESATVGAPPAVMLAALDALRPLGVKHLETPLTPLRVWEAIQAAQSSTERIG